MPDVRLDYSVPSESQINSIHYLNCYFIARLLRSSGLEPDINLAGYPPKGVGQLVYLRATFFTTFPTADLADTFRRFIQFFSSRNTNVKNYFFYFGAGK